MKHVLEWRYLQFALAFIGLGLGIYLTVAHYVSPALLVCSNSGLVNCARVTTSPQSVVLGIPVAVLGLLYFVGMLFLTHPRSLGSWRLYPWRYAYAVVGIIFVLYLVYTELFVIGSICMYCTAVHVDTFLLFALIVTAARPELPVRQTKKEMASYKAGRKRRQGRKSWK